MEMRPFAAIGLALALGFTLACFASSYILGELIPADGANIRKMSGGRQIDFVVTRSNDDAAVSEKSLASYRKAGWKYCASNEWDTYSEQINGRSRRVLQRVAYLYHDQDVIAIVERYFGGEVGDIDRTSNRNVTLVSQTLSASDIRSIIDSSRLECR